MEILWKVEDGFVNNGTQYFELPDEEIQECETEQEAMELVEGALRDDFAQKISPCFDDYDSIMEGVRKLLSEKKDNDL